MKRCLYLGIVLAIGLSFNKLKAEEPWVLNLKNGSQIECLSASVNGNQVILKIKYGNITFDKSAFTDESLYRLQNENKPPPVLKQTAKTQLNRDDPAPASVSNLENGSPTAGQEDRKHLADSTNSSTTNIEIPTQPTLSSVLPASQSETISLPAALPVEPTFPADAKYEVKTVEYDCPGFGSQNGTVKIQALIPQDSGGLIPRSASNIVFFAPPLGWSKILIPESRLDKSDSNKMFWDLARIYGMTVFTADFATTLADVPIKSRCYYYPESGAFDLILKARKKLISDLGLETKPMYIIGYSGGATMAERWPLLYPKDIAAIAITGGGGYAPLNNALDIPFLVLTTKGDDPGLVAENEFLSKRAAELGMNLLYAEAPPAVTQEKDYEGEMGQHFHHNASILEYDLLQQFIISIAFNDAESNPLKWPMRAKRDYPYAIYKVPSLDTQETLRDIIAFPTESFAQLWGCIPYRYVEIGKESGLPFQVTIRYPKTQPNGVVIFQPAKDEDPAISGDYLDFLAIEGFIGISCDCGDGEITRLDRTKKLLAWALSRGEFHDLKLGLIGFGTGGRHCFIAGARNNSERIAGIGTVDSPLDWPFPELSPKIALAQLSHPAIFGYSEGPEGDDLNDFVEQAKESFKSVDAIDVSDIKDPKLQWFDALELLLNKIFPDASSNQNSNP